jgi:hypothetical protein
MKKRSLNYEWLVGYRMNDLVFNGICDKDNMNKNKNSQYEFIKYDDDNKPINSILMNYQDFKEYISKYNLEGLKR